MNNKLDLIKGQLVRIDYAKNKIEKLLHINDYVPEKKKTFIDWKKELEWYMNNVEYHLDKIRQHIATAEEEESGIVKLAVKETDCLIERLEK